MRTPKEKAKELVNKYYNLLLNIANVTNAILYAKHCALIAVDEILKVPELSFNQHDFWQEVKTEIEKL